MTFRVWPLTLRRVAMALGTSVLAAGLAPTAAGAACAPLTSPYSQAVSSTPGIVGYWRLGEASSSTACDSVGANPGSYEPGTTPGAPGALAGDPDTATALDGSSGYVNVPYSPSLNVGDRFTVETWVKRARDGITETIASKQQGGWLLEFNDYDQLTLRRSFVADVMSSTATVTDTAWHYVAATKDGSTIHLYLDGRDVTGPVLSPQTMTDNTQPLVIGESINSSYLEGTVDDVAVYNLALTPAQIAYHYSVGTGAQTPAAPNNLSPPAVSGTARSGQTLSATTGTWAGATPMTFAYQWQRCDATGAGCTAVSSPTASSYTLGASDVGSRVRVSVTASNASGSTTRRSAATPVVAAPADPVVVAVGDIACAPGDSTHGCQQGSTAALAAAQNPTAILTLGDNQYNSGLLSEFDGPGAYDATWGRFDAIVHPAPGNHEYAQSSDAAGYFGYFGSSAANGDYSLHIGNWHIISLNSSCGDLGCSDSAMGQTTTAQTAWLQGNLEADASTCTLAYWHHPRFSSSWNGDSPDVGPLWNALYGAHADVVLGGHDHLYERYAPQTPSGAANLGGIREFVVGTGGEDLEGLGQVEPHLRVSDTSDYGVLVLTLHPSSYHWAFKRLGGRTVDSGSNNCHGASATKAVTQTPRALAAPGPGPVGPALTFDAAPLRSSRAAVVSHGLRVAIKLSRGADVSIRVAVRRGGKVTRIASFREGDEQINRPYTVISLPLAALKAQPRGKVTLALRLVARDAVGRYRTVTRGIVLG